MAAARKAAWIAARVEGRDSSSSRAGMTTENRVSGAVAVGVGIREGGEGEGRRNLWRREALRAGGRAE